LKRKRETILREQQFRLLLGADRKKDQSNKRGGEDSVDLCCGQEKKREKKPSLPTVE